jgi:CheY-like chemotaxis protein
MENPSIRVLQVEDDAGEVRLVHEMLRRAEGVTYQITNAGCLQEALDRLRDSAFDVILLDLTLPDSRELNTFHRVKVEAFDTPLIVLSGYGDREFARAAVRKGAQDFLVKGHVDRHLLDCSIRYALERHRLYKRMAKVNNTLLEEERNRVVEETAGCVAHEINQPLMVMSLVTEQMLLETDPSDPNYEQLMTLRCASERIDRIVKHMLAVRVYATRPYGKDIDILDLEAASGKASPDSGRAEA